MTLETISKTVDINSQPVELVTQLVQYMIEVLKFSLQSTSDFLKAVKLPQVAPLTPADAAHRINKTIGAVLNYTQLQIITNALIKYLKQLSLSNYLPSFVISVLTYMVNQLISLNGRFVTFIPLLLLKLYSPTNFVALKALQNANGASKEEEIAFLNMYIQSLVETITKEREQHSDDVTKLSSLEQEGVKAIETVQRVKRDFEYSVQELLLRFEEETEKHRADVEQLNLALQTAKTDSEGKIARINGEFERQMQELTKANEELTILNAQLKVEAGEKLQKMINDCNGHSEALIHKIESERQMYVELEELKRQNQHEKEEYLAQISKEREECQKAIENLLELQEAEKAKTNEKIYQFIKDFESQKKKLLMQIESERIDWVQQLDQFKLSGKTGNAQIEISQVEKLLEQISKEREQLKLEIEKLTLKDISEQPDKDLQTDTNTKSVEFEEDIFDGEREEYKQKIKALQDTITKLQKKPKGSSKIFGTINKALSSKVVDKADKKTLT